MDLERIRNLSDKELTKYLKNLSERNTSMCTKCGQLRANYTINIQNKKKIQQKKLCSLCENCYNDMLDTMGFQDILWA